MTEGRRELETAAALSPRRAVFRTWLGRAYAAEGLSDKALAQYALARAADPDDPAPWLLEAETLFLENRVVEALASVRAAQDRADGRATLRSERGLDEDRAVQGAVLGRLLQTLGFDQEALQVGARGAEQDATNPAAHGIVADLLRRRERQEIAAVSAALAEQVWRSPSKQSLDPTRQETSLAALDGPAAARPSFAELGPYFESDGFRGAVSGFGGTQERFGGQISGALLHEGWSASAAVSHEQDQGYRFNNEAYTTIAGAELRGTLDAGTDFFLEYRYRSSDFGDRVLEFDTSTGNPVTDQSLERNVIRAGIKRRIGADHDIAGVITFTQEDESLATTADFFNVPSLTTAEGEGVDVQLQHVARAGPLSFVSGLAFADATTDAVNALDFGFFVFETRSSAESFQATAYSYANVLFETVPVVSNVEFTLGASVDWFDLDEQDVFGITETVTTFSPKVGGRIGVTDWLDLRGAWTRSVIPAALSPQRLEPATVAGFSQMTDQPGGSRVQSAGVGLDLRPFDPFIVTLEAQRWRVTRPGFGPTDFEAVVRELRGSATYALSPQVAVSLEGLRIDSDGDPRVIDLDRYEVGELAGSVVWFHPSGFFASARGGMVWHEFEDNGASGRDTFPMLDVVAGYRLPDRRGVLTVEFQNTTDSSFSFADRPTLLNGEVATPRYARDFTAIGRFTFGF